MNKEFIPYEQALELKELGFNEGCFKCYFPDGDLDFNIENGYYNNLTLSQRVAAPLYQQSFRWFREKYGLRYYIEYNSRCHNYDLILPTNLSFLTVFSYIDTYDTYEEAELACLKKLIEIAKNK